MDLDQNDLLSSNMYILKPNLDKNISRDANDEFKSYFEKELSIQEESKIKLRISDVNIEKEEDSTTLASAIHKNKGQNNTDRIITEQRTLVSIDSRDRIKNIYLKPNNFSIFLGRTFSNIKKIELVSIEFPNTNAVINSSNNTIYWRNQEDIDLDITIVTNGIIDYPVYSVNLRIGNYTSSNLQNEITSKLNLVRRKQGLSNSAITVGDYHYFVTSLDIDTDIVSFTSLILQQLSNDPLSTQIGSGLITVTAYGHGYSTNDLIYFIGAKSISGIIATTIIGFQKIIVKSINEFTFEVTTKAGQSAIGGGNTIKIGKKTNFQFLWGQSNNTVGQNLGFPLENSSKLISTNISSFQNIYQMIINTILPHNFSTSYDYINNLVYIGNIDNNTNFNYTVNYPITNITGTNSILVQLDAVNLINANNIVQNNKQFKTMQIHNLQLDISSVEIYTVNSFLITTSTNHNYTLTDINKTIQLSNTLDPNNSNNTNSTSTNINISYDGSYIIQSIPSTKTIILPGILSGITPTSGTIVRQNLLTSYTLNIESIINVLTYTKITTTISHNLIIGDYISIFNVSSTQTLLSSYKIIAITGLTSFLINTILSNVIISSISYIGTGIITVSFPEHGFNKITNIENNTDNSGTLIIQTINPHNLVSNNTIRLSGTNTTPNIDGGNYIITNIDTYHFSINYSTTLTNIPTVITGILGMSNKFYIYGSTDLGGITKNKINDNIFTVRDIIDINTFTFVINSFATKTEIGGGSAIYISSLIHGFSGIQQNIKNNILNRTINLQGENYCFLTCPQLNTMLNTGSVTNIFARISLNQSPGFVCFDFLSNPKEFNIIPLDKLSTLDFSVITYSNNFFDFQDLDFSFCIRITEVSDATDSFNISSKRGIRDVS